MMKKKLLFPILVFSGLPVAAQRQMETLDRGLVAVQTADGVFASWRIDGTEYYDTQYNLYRDGTRVNPEPLDVSNFTDAGGSLSSTYTVRAVVRGVEQDDSKPAKVWNQQYMEIPMGKIYSRRGTDITASYSLNDATAADLDGDGEYEIIVKRIYDPDDLFDVPNDSAYAFFEAYKLDGTKLWAIDVGPNMINSGHVETNIIAYDWDLDGKAEVLMRATDGTIIRDAEGRQQAVVGDLKANYRDQISHSGNMTYATAGNEYLIYMEGATAQLYGEPMEFPLKRFEAGESNLEAVWGDGYGHRSNKFFFGAPYLDGRKPSVFLARGIYTRHKMIAYDVNPQTHELTVRWRWNCSTGGSPWFGQGYHNYGIADVDWDGRDEIVYGSMVIDDNGKGLSTTGLGHGDAQHCSDFDPYRKGQEIFACNENAQGANYRDATTSQIYYMHHYGKDCVCPSCQVTFHGYCLCDVARHLVSHAFASEAHRNFFQRAAEKSRVPHEIINEGAEVHFFEENAVVFGRGFVFFRIMESEYLVLFVEMPLARGVIKDVCQFSAVPFIMYASGFSVSLAVVKVISYFVHVFPGVISHTCVATIKEGYGDSSYRLRFVSFEIHGGDVSS